ncbi:MAG: GldG family protein [Acidobacteria bacterium]|nr:GldG family protein [Acidobacteriota bacterium]
MNINRQEISRLAGFVGAALLIAGLVRNNIQEIWGWFNLTLVIAGGVLLLASIILNIGEIIAFFRGRTGRLGTNTIILGIAVIAILGVLNYLGYRYHKRFDLTAEGLYSLSDQSKKILSGLSKDVRVIRFDKADDQRLTDLMAEFKYNSQKIKFERIDPQQKPEVARQFNVQRMGETVVAAGERIERPTGSNEQDLINAIMKVTRDQLKTICFVEGHGEKEMAGTTPEGYGTVNSGLKNENYQSKSVNLVTANEVPTDCSVLVIAGPKSAYFPQEAAMIGKYLDAGGKGLVMIDPETDPGLNDMLKSWNIEIGNDTVIDVSGVGRLFGTGPAVPLVGTYGEHPITKDMGRTATFFPLARSVKTGEAAKGDMFFTDLLKTSDASWGETNLQGNEAKFDEGADKKGPVTLGVTASKKTGEKEGRLVVVGDSDFATNNYVRMRQRRSFLNSINWLAQDEDLISIRPKSMTNRSVTMTESQQRTFFWLTVLLMPLAVIGTGAYVWWKRR